MIQYISLLLAYYLRCQKIPTSTLHAAVMNCQSQPKAIILQILTNEKPLKYGYDENYLHFLSRQPNSC